MGEHIKASCHSLTEPQVTEYEEGSSHAAETEMVKGIRRIVQEAGEMKALLERAFGDNRALHDSVCEISQSMNSVKESMREGVSEQITDAIQPIVNGISTLHGARNSEQRHIVERIARVEAAIKTAEEGAKASNKTLQHKVEKLIGHAHRNVTRCEFIVSRVKALEAEVMKYGSAVHLHGPVYLRGYNISPGVKLTTPTDCMDGKRGGVYLRICLQLHKGDMDEDLLWTFEHEVRLTILHPLLKEPYVIKYKTSRNMEYYGKPTRASNPPTGLGLPTDFEEIKRGGYISDDAFRVVWELL
ncbi:hypothetical protein MTO96_002574 [Rhipicephalus appendiculatus]